MAISAGSTPSIPGVYIDNDIRTRQYHIVVDYRALHDAPYDPWSILIGQALHNFHGMIREETLEKMPIEDLETLAQMIINEMDKR